MGLPVLALLVVIQLVLDHVDHDLVRDQLALIHDLLRLPAELGLRGHLRAQHVSGSQMADTVLLLDLRRLGALACASPSVRELYPLGRAYVHTSAWRSNKDHAHALARGLATRVISLQPRLELVYTFLQRANGALELVNDVGGGHFAGGEGVVVAGPRLVGSRSSRRRR